MKNNKFPIELICSKDQLLPSMNGVYIDNGYAVATDGHALVIMNLADMDMECLGKLEGKIIKAELFKKINARKLSLAVTDSGQINIDGDIIGNAFIKEKFPDYRRVLGSEYKEVEIIGLDAENLVRIQKAFNTKNLALSFSGNNRAINILPMAELNLDFRAICMPFMCVDRKGNYMKPFTISAPACKELQSA